MADNPAYLGKCAAVSKGRFLFLRTQFSGFVCALRLLTARVYASISGQAPAFSGRFVLCRLRTESRRPLRAEGQPVRRDRRACAGHTFGV